MDFEEARAVKREPIETGKRYPFYSTAQDTAASDGSLLRQYTGREMLVIGCVADQDEEVEPMYIVNVGNGVTFDAYEGELNGFYYDTGQFFGPEGKYGEA